jgi:hypothetical protein
VAQGIGPEFKPSTAKNKKVKKDLRPTTTLRVNLEAKHTLAPDPYKLEHICVILNC